MTQREVPWEQGKWTVDPEAVRSEGDRLVVTPARGSDLWRHTSYGFVHDDAPALLGDLPDGRAVEVDFVLGGSEQFDQAGVLLRADAEHWIKAGVEFSDGRLMAGAVVTAGVSDWSTGPVDDWAGRQITVRASRSGAAVTVRARCGDEPWQLLRLAPIDPQLPWRAGPFCASPTRAGLRVEFAAWRLGPADDSLH
ncbi:hypothetical protein BJY21_002107 [Kineosphaera limosa]|uniref:DUF1349 domain-containing protein n=1 Tax=Kineosphaera limosa NBRC 100340 TaxID=1184609 RepID=K6WS27_9MICO|nr:DUF1349 domain-containing protein [Kineosphaera limosa]NYE00923.1 hypothetical protein [Kineosphaera limosa]GAB94882.1 hypothetical protein KILIM_014_00170 [Kineosphaera limosa NBRC 100340]